MATVRRLTVLAWLAALPALTAMRAPVFQNNVTAWTEATQGSIKPRPWLNLGAAYLAAQRYDEARIAIATATTLAGQRVDQDERRVSEVYGVLLIARITLLEGQWTKAAVLAAQLNATTGRTWPPAVALCRQLACSP